jgi:Alpha galactosidase C-terminal beta sandwich domain
LRYTFAQLGLKDHAYAVRDLWEHKDLGRMAKLDLTLPAHASVLYSFTPSAQP